MTDKAIESSEEPIEHRHHRKGDEVEADEGGLTIPWKMIAKALTLIALSGGGGVWMTATYNKTAETATNTGAMVTQGQTLEDIEARLRRAEVRIAPLDPAWRPAMEGRVGNLEGGQVKILGTIEDVKDLVSALKVEVLAMRREAREDRADRATENTRGGRGR